MRILILILLVTGIAGCISNDVPLPVVYGNVQKIEFNGQQKCVINTKTRTIDLTLSDTVNIERVRLNLLEVSADPARAQELDLLPEVSISTDTFLNLSQPFKFTIQTYQTYEWTINTEQPIERYFRVENQVGESVINVSEKMVLIYVTKEQSLSDIRVTEVQLGSSIATYEPEPTTLTNFIRKQHILVNCFGKSEKWEIGVFYKEDNAGNENEITGSANAWAKFAYLDGKIPSGKTGTVGFEYKQAKASAWTKVEAEVKGTVFSARINDLKPQTNYVFRGVIGNEVGSEVAFSTEAAEQVSYSNFDAWYKDGKAWYTGVEGITTWDSGNKGGASFGFNPTSEETADVVKGSAARLASCYAAVKFAAGSLYTGKFAGLDGFNAKLDFGIPYTCRPTTLSGYYKYNSGTVDKDEKNKYPHIMGKADSCHIYVALCNWTKSFTANSGTETFVDYSTNNSSIIAYGELKNDRKMDAYEKFTIDLEYRDLTTKPTYIVIVATSSRYGDYFAGSTQSVLLLDEFELGFD